MCYVASDFAYLPLPSLLTLQYLGKTTREAYEFVEGSAGSY